MYPKAVQKVRLKVVCVNTLPKNAILKQIENFVCSFWTRSRNSCQTNARCICSQMLKNISSVSRSYINLSCVRRRLTIQLGKVEISLLICALWTEPPLTAAGFCETLSNHKILVAYILNAPTCWSVFALEFFSQCSLVCQMVLLDFQM